MTKLNDVPAAALQPGPRSGFAATLEGWRMRLASAGVVCRSLAFACADPALGHDFPPEQTDLIKVWAALRERVTPEVPFVLGKCGTDMLMVVSLQSPDGGAGVLGLCLAPPHGEKMVHVVQLSLGWLQLALSSKRLADSLRSARLLELMGHVVSQQEARAAAQEWVNRMASWVRAEAPLLEGLSLMLFEVRRHVAHWWVSADSAWAEKGSPALREATEVATRAMVEVRETSSKDGWAIPLLDDGRPSAVLVVRTNGLESPVPALPGTGLLAGSLSPEVQALVRAGAGLAEPLLRHWRHAERPLPQHAVEASKEGWRKLTGPGHLSWKFAAGVATLVLAVLLLWPVSDRVTANLVIEGRVRQVMTAPFDGFVAQALVRPGERVKRGQVLARLDDRELRLEQGKTQSERDQAGGKLRQAMADRDAAAMQVAGAELRQAEAQLALVEAKLARAELVSPLDGIVVSGDWSQQVGGPVETGKEMFEVAAVDGYRVVLQVPDRDIARVRVGQGGALRLAGQPQQTYAFKVTNVTATASVQEGANGFRVEAGWDGAAPTLSPGMQGVGKVTVGEANLLTVCTRPMFDWLRLKLWSWWW